MRDILDDIFKNQPLDPIEAARKSVRVNLRKRFYKQAGVADHAVTLDGKPVMTPKRRALKAPNAAIVQAMAGEWDAQRDTIDPGAMPMTRLANAIIDGVADAPNAVRDEIVKYLGSDLVFYRADQPEGLIEEQAKHWDPIIAFARDTYGARFVLAQGIVHQAQPPEAIAAAAVSIPHDASTEAIWTLGALAAIVTITGSALIALALAAKAMDADAAWQAAHVDEDWNAAKWGEDPEVQARRAARRAEFDAAVLILRAV
ncbi:MAG TPA: ATP12 family protein [Pseudolabrys sp.]|nr:ATP12 family protein [Pseudolabrys sp.]